LEFSNETWNAGVVEVECVYVAGFCGTWVETVSNAALASWAVEKDA
jgi:hypothetical protein